MSLREADADVFGYPAGPPRQDGAWAACRLRVPVGGGMLQLDPRDAADVAAFRAHPGYSGSPVVVTSDGVGGAVVGMLAVASGKDGPRDVYAIPMTQLIDAWPEVLAKLTIPACPYRGLEPFRAQDARAGLFVGREDETDRLRGMVNEHALVMVVGPSTGSCLPWTPTMRHAGWYARCGPTFSGRCWPIPASETGCVHLPMGEDALERAVTEPARAAGVTYEEGLARQIAVDAAGGDGGLPLMQ
ncbi:MAG TPA: hypothetical protein VN327_16440, partial [Pseudonocardiaceae bacterium]|nr:hypothetical protein [Pseudonocardiaceae bacterium]